MDIIGDFVSRYLVPEFFSNIAQLILGWIEVALFLVLVAIIAVYDWIKTKFLAFWNWLSKPFGSQSRRNSIPYAFMLRGVSDLTGTEVEHFAYGWSAAYRGQAQLMNANPLGIQWEIQEIYEDRSRELFSMSVERAKQMEGAMIKKMENGLVLVTAERGEQPMREVAKEMRKSPTPIAQ